MLRIEKLMTPGTNIYDFDFTLLTGVRKVSPSLSKGRKVSATYVGIDGDLYAKKTFTDVIENGKLVGIDMLIQWYDHEGNVGLEKPKRIVDYNSGQAETAKRNRRERQIDYLKAGAKDKAGAAGEAIIDFIWSKYERQRIDYIGKEGDDTWVKAMVAETDLTARAYLDQVFDQETGATVMQALIHELTPEA